MLRPFLVPHPLLDRVRSCLLLVMLGLGGWKFLSVINQHYPVDDWLFWIFFRHWILSLGWAFSCVSAGHGALRVLLSRRVFPVREHLMFSFGLGFLIFFLAMVLTGLGGLYRPWLFWVLPAAIAAPGAKGLYRYGRRLGRHVAYRRARRTRPSGALDGVWFSLSLLGFLLLYLPTLTPTNVLFDAIWYHLPIAEHYVAQHGVQPFAEGWYLGTYPHLASFLYTWAFLRPQLPLFERVVFAAQLEVVVFLATMFSVSVLVRRLLPGVRAPYAGAAIFLFPEIFLYDSNLAVGADHVAAFWAIPIYVALVHVWRSWSPRHAILLAAMIAGAADTKYTALVVVIFPLLAFGGRLAWLTGQRAAGRGPEASVWQAPLAATVAGLVLTAPHWLKNWVWYGDPVYPLLHRHLTLHPWTPDAVIPFENYFIKAAWDAPERSWAGFKAALKVVYTYSFIPNDWFALHGKVPLFGSLFTLTLLCLPFLPRTRRLWGIYLAGHLGVFCWYWNHPLDRYLQPLVPWMAAAVVAVAILLWREGFVHRLGLLALFGLQFVWGMDTPFIQTHSMAPGKSHIRAASELFAANFRPKDRKGQRDFLSDYVAVGLSVPEGSRWLVHDMYGHLGLGAPAVSDAVGTQGGISYARLASPRAIHDLFRRLGVTHILTPSRNREQDSISGDLLFFDYLKKYGQSKSVEGFLVTPLPAPPTEAPFHDVVAYFGCRRGWAPGLYHLADLAISPHDPRPDTEFPHPFTPWQAGQDTAPLVRAASFLVTEPGCHGLKEQDLSRGLLPLTTREHTQLFARRSDP